MHEKVQTIDTENNLSHPTNMATAQKSLTSGHIHVKRHVQNVSKTIQRGPAAQASWFLPLLCVAQAFPVSVQAANPEGAECQSGESHLRSPAI